MSSLNKLLLGVAALGLSASANAALVVTAGTPGTTGATGLYMDQLSSLTTSDGTATTAELQAYIGKPDDVHTGLANAWIQFDLGDYRLINGAGADFNVYEVDGGSVEFTLVDILVSLDGTNWYNVDADTVTFTDLAGDEAHGNPNFRRSYDVTNALAALGVSELRYLRLDGTSGGAAIGGDAGFDPDAVGYINFTSPEVSGPVPEPASWAMMIGGLGIVGAAMRRRARVAFA